MEYPGQLQFCSAFVLADIAASSVDTLILGGHLSPLHPFKFFTLGSESEHSFAALATLAVSPKCCNLLLLDSVIMAIQGHGLGL